MSEENVEEQDQEQPEVEAPFLDIENALATHLLDTRGSWEKNGRIYASDLGLALGPEFAGCQVAFWHKCRNAPTKDVNAGRLLLLQAGDLLHDWMGDALKMALPIQGWRVVSIETRVYLDHDDESIGSRLDILIEHMETGWRTVIDVKTKRGNAFGYLTEVKPGDELQVQGYIKAADADDGWVLYVDREGQNFVRAFYVEREDHRPEQAITILKGIRDADEPPETLPLGISITENKGADSVYLKKPWQIEWCDLEKCACAAAFPYPSVPKKVVAKLHPQDTYVEVRLTESGKEWGDIIVDLLNAEVEEGEPMYALQVVEPEPEE